jgi:hypothetical protein
MYRKGRLARFIPAICALVFVPASSAICAAPAWAESGFVTSSGDTGADGTLRYEVTHANDGETVTFAPGINPTLGALFTSQIPITHAITIEGNGVDASGTTITGLATDRIFDIDVGGAKTVAISNLILTGGHAPAGTGDGGAGKGGGAILVESGNLALDGVGLFGNHAGDGSPGIKGANASGVGNGGTGHTGGGGGAGGAISATGDLTIRNSTIDLNFAGDGANGGDGGSGAGGGGGGTGGTGGFGGTGGAIVDFGGTTTIIDSTFALNIAGLGGTGGNGGGGSLTGGGGTGGQGGKGGAIASGPFTPAIPVSGSTFEGNGAGGGGHGGDGGLSPGSGGIGGDGGALSVLGATIVNSTFTDNTAGSGGSGGGTTPIVGAGGNGGNGGAYDGPPQIRFSTIARNSAGIQGATGGGSDGVGGGIHSLLAGTLADSIVAGNEASGSTGSAGANCAGTVPTGSSDLTFPGSTGCPGSVGDPLLGELADNTGPTQTMALAAGSPAIDAAGTTGCQATDQRGVSRPQGDACDIGAYELILGAKPAPNNTSSTPTKRKCKKKHKKKGKPRKKKGCKKRKKKHH